MATDSIFSGASEAKDSIFGDDVHAETASAHPAAEGHAPVPGHLEDLAKVVLTPGQTVVHVPVTPGEVVELPFGADSHFLARLGDGNLAIKVGDVTVVLQGYAAAAGQTPPVIEGADGKPIDIASIIAETDPAIDIQTAAGPGQQGGQGAGNTGGIFQQFGEGGGLGGFEGAGSQDNTDGPGGDDNGGTNPLLHTLTLAVNTPPAVSSFDAVTDEDTEIAGQLVATDKDGDPVTFHVVGEPPKGLTVNPDGTWSFDPRGTYDYLAEGEKTTVTFQYQANDGKADGNIATGTIEIDGRNDPATITGEEGSRFALVKEDQTLTASGTLTVTDADHDQSHTQADSVTTAYGTWSIDTDGKWTYTLDNTSDAVQSLAEGDAVIETYTVKSTDGTASQNVTITIEGTNDAATITGEKGSTAGLVKEDQTLGVSGTLTVTDADHDQSHTQADSVTTAYGTWSIDTDGHWTYTLDNTSNAVQSLAEGETVTETYTVKSQDGTAAQDVTITIEGTNDVPTIAGDTTGTVKEDSLLRFFASGQIQVTDPDAGQSHTDPVLAGASQHGFWHVDTNGNWFYLLNNLDLAVQQLPAGKTMLDTFTITTADGTTQDITITIQGTNDKPLIIGDSKGSVTEDGQQTATGTLYVLDIDKDESSAKPDSGKSTYGTWSVDADGNWTYHLNNDNAKVQSLGAGQTLTDSFTVKSEDGSNSQKVEITIHGTNDPATISGTTTGDVYEDGATQKTGAKLTVSDVDAGQAQLQPQTGVDGTYGTWSVKADGTWTYTLDNGKAQSLGEGVTATDSLVVKSQDGTDSKELQVTIHGVNDTATISGTTTGDVYEDGAVQNAGAKLIISDADAGEAQLQPQASVDGAYGTWSVQADGTWTYTLDNGKAQSLGGTETAVETLTVKSQDGTGTTQLQVTVHGANDAPVINDPNGGNAATVSMAENTTLVTTIKATDVDIHDTLTYSIKGGADQNLFQIDAATGALSFKSAPDFEDPKSSNHDNTYSVTVQVSDGHGGTDTQAITVKVTDVAEGPATQSDHIFTNESGLFSVQNEWLLANDKGNGLQIDDVHTDKANESYYDPLSLVPYLPFVDHTPAEHDGSVYVDLDTTGGFLDNTYINSGHPSTVFTYEAVDSAHQSADGTVTVTYVNSPTIDRSGDTDADIIVGSSSGSTLKGGAGDDVISGGSGNDLIFGNGGSDTIYGGGGDDVIHYGAGDTVHGGGDNIGTHAGLFSTSLLTDTAHRGDVLVFSESVNLTDSKYDGAFDGIETISIKNADSGVASSTNQTLTVNASDVMGMSDHFIDPSGSRYGDLLGTKYSDQHAVRIDMDKLDDLYLSITKDGGKWTNIGTTSDGSYDVFVHDTNAAGATGSSENAYVMVSHAAVADGHVHLNTDPVPQH